MIPENYKLLIEKLKQKTLKKEANWSKTSADDEYKLDLGKGAITIDNWRDNGKTYIDLSIINDRGDIIDRIYFPSGETEDYNLVLELHSLAKRAYYKIDETLKNIFKELDSDKPIGNVNPVDDLPF